MYIIKGFVLCKSNIGKHNKNNKYNVKSFLNLNNLFKTIGQIKKRNQMYKFGLGSELLQLLNLLKFT
jgi:hypothetical protein